MSGQSQPYFIQNRRVPVQKIFMNVEKNNDLSTIAALNSPENNSIAVPAFHYVHAAISNNTRIAYQRDIKHFRDWGGLLPTTSDAIVKYLHCYAAALNPKTLKRRLIALKQWHTSQGFNDPTNILLIRKTLSGIQKTHGLPTKQAKALSLDALQILVDYLQKQPKLIHVRNNALLQIGFFAALRRSELIQLRFEHITFVPDKGMEILIPRSKTDQEGQGQSCAIPYGDDRLCPIRALEAWCSRANIHSGPVFRQLTKGGNVLPNAIAPAQLNAILKNLAVACRLNDPFDYSGHSLRRGFATTASQNHAPLATIMRQGRWRHERTVLNYIEAGQRFDENAVNLIFKNRNQS